MKTRKCKNLQIKVRDDKGNEGWILMTEFSQMMLETIGEAIYATTKDLSQAIKTSQKGKP